MVGGSDGETSALLETALRAPGAEAHAAEVLRGVCPLCLSGADPQGAAKCCNMQRENVTCNGTPRGQCCIRRQRRVVVPWRGTGPQGTTAQQRLSLACFDVSCMLQRRPPTLHREFSRRMRHLTHAMRGVNVARCTICSRGILPTRPRHMAIVAIAAPQRSLGGEAVLRISGGLVRRARRQARQEPRRLISVRSPSVSTRGSLLSSGGVAALWPAGGRRAALGGQGGALA